MIDKKLKQLRQKKKLTLHELSEKTKITESALSRLENAKTKSINFSSLETIASFYKIKVSELFK